MKLEDALKQVSPGEDIEAAYDRLFGKDVQPLEFIQWHKAVRQVPQELIQKIRETAKLTPDEAFKKLYPDYINKMQFVDAVIAAQQAKKNPVVQQPIQQPAAT